MALYNSGWLPACPVCAVPQSGVVLGGTAILSAVNGLTPHMAGAIDIMVVQQPDGSLKCSPFYGEGRLLQEQLLCQEDALQLAG